MWSLYANSLLARNELYNVVKSSRFLRTFKRSTKRKKYTKTKYVKKKVRKEKSTPKKEYVKKKLRKEKSTPKPN